VPERESELNEDDQEWPSFELSAEQRQQIDENIPDEDQAIWEQQAAQPELTEEDWSSQEVDEEQDLVANSNYMSIDELMGQIEQQESGTAADEEELNLDVGLNEFPDVIGDVEAYDVDNNSEAIGKLDLAKIYLEMNDVDGAVRLLDQAIELGDESVVTEAAQIKEGLS
jgi:FimV-like protein